MRRVVTTAALALAALALPPATAGTGGDAAAGMKTFKTMCHMCHSTTSTEREIGPGLKGLFKNKKMPASDRPVTEAAVREQIREGGGGMPPFKERLDETELADLIAYLKTL